MNLSIFLLIVSTPVQISAQRSWVSLATTTPQAKEIIRGVTTQNVGHTHSSEKSYPKPRPIATGSQSLLDRLEGPDFELGVKRVNDARTLIYNTAKTGGAESAYLLLNQILDKHPDMRIALWDQQHDLALLVGKTDQAYADMLWVIVNKNQTSNSALVRFAIDLELKGEVYAGQRQYILDQVRVAFREGHSQDSPGLEKYITKMSSSGFISLGFQILAHDSLPQESNGFCERAYRTEPSDPFLLRMWARYFKYSDPRKSISILNDNSINILSTDQADLQTDLKELETIYNLRQNDHVKRP